MKIFRKGDPEVDPDLKALETKLREYHQPIPPRTEFVTGLYNRLITTDISEAQHLLSGNTSKRLLVAGGITGSVLLVITSIRGLISLLGVLGLLVQYLLRNGRRQQVKPV